MLTPDILPILLCLRMAGAIPFVTNNLTGVSYQGISDSGVERFQNIFCAEATSGAHRFAPPVPFLPARGSTIQATARGGRMSSGTIPFSNLPIRVDCRRYQRRLSELTHCETSQLFVGRAAPSDGVDLWRCFIHDPLPLGLSRLISRILNVTGGFIFGEAYDRFL